MNIEEIYGQFGPNVTAEVRHQVNRHGSLRPLLKKLNIPSAPSAQAQHDALKSFIYQFGVSFFLTVVGSEITADDVERMKARKLLQSSERVRQSASDSSSRRATLSGTYTEPHHSSPSTTEAERPEASAAAAPASAQAEGKKWIKSENYEGPDRRSGIERRQTPDRRSRVDLVFKNQRFGGGRRQTVRREEDRKKLEEK